MEKKSNRKSNTQNKKMNERKYIGKNKMSGNTEWQIGKETMYQKVRSNTIKDVIKIRLHMWKAKCSYKRNESDTTCPLCRTKADNTMIIQWEIMIIQWESQMNWHNHIEIALNRLMMKKERTQTTELRKEWKETGVVC